MIYLSRENAELIKNNLNNINDQQDHKYIWKRRQYAPMYIHDSSFKKVKDDIISKYPNYTIVFDVVFESDGNIVNWHCDYESLGPFEIKNNWESIRDSHFLTIHFNLTENGGSLITLPWKNLSYIYNFINIYTGIFSIFHYTLNYLLIPLFYTFSKVHTNKSLYGNSFDNMRLHSVSKGDKRVSYVVRLVKNNSIMISKQSIIDGIKRSNACTVFKKLLDIVDKEPKYVSDIDWGIFIK